MSQNAKKTANKLIVGRSYWHVASTCQRQYQVFSCQTCTQNPCKIIMANLFRWPWRAVWWMCSPLPNGRWRKPLAKSEGDGWPIYDADDLKTGRSLARHWLPRIWCLLSVPTVLIVARWGFDEPQLKNCLTSMKSSIFVWWLLPVSATRGIYSEQYRFERERFIVKV